LTVQSEIFEQRQKELCYYRAIFIAYFINECQNHHHPALCHHGSERESIERLLPHQSEYLHPLSLKRPQLLQLLMMSTLLQ
jgi:hypothetical protein